MPQTSAANTSNAPEKFAFDPEMAKLDLLGLLKYPPFTQIDHSKFPKGSESITEILKNDSRIRHFSAGDLIIRQGEYANSAFIILRGRVRIVLQQLEIAEQEQAQKNKLGIWQRIVACARNGGRSRGISGNSFKGNAAQSMGLRNEQETRPQLYLKDVDAVLSASGAATLDSGSLFGEIAAMTRSANEYTVVAQDACTVLEVRWQGLRQLRRDRAFRQALDDRYRETSLRTWLSQHELLQYCPANVIEKIATRAVLQSYGEREWFVQYNQDRSARSSEQIAAEPLICSEGEHADSLIIVRSGFARKSYAYGDSQRTETYLSQSHLFGFEELCHNSQIADRDFVLPYQYSLRALGYLDVIRIDRETFVNEVLPYCRKESLPEKLDKPRLDRFASLTPEHYYQPIENTQEDALLEFLLENRLINASEAMIINTDRCTRCDDCVRACATGHGGVSRFNRTGITLGNFQFTQSCMHCVDPVCMIGCPTGAIRRDSNTGVVSINDQTCIGCKTCADACPYNNIAMEVVQLRNSLLPILGGEQEPLVASKCDMCQRLPGGPACVAACPHEALERVDLSDTDKIRQWLNRQ